MINTQVTQNRGFSLIELLVVISAISLLASMVIAAVTTAREKAMTQKALTDMQVFASIVSFAQGESGKTLMKISEDGGATLSACSSCKVECANPIVLRHIPSTNACYIEWTKVLDGVRMYSGGSGENLKGMLRDPWGSPYLVDQNQGEGGNCSSGNRDIIYSAGPDGIKSTADDIGTVFSMPMSINCP